MTTPILHSEIDYKNEHNLIAQSTLKSSLQIDLR